MQNNIGKDICVLVETENFLNRGDSVCVGGFRDRKRALLPDAERWKVVKIKKEDEFVCSVVNCVCL